MSRAPRTHYAMETLSTGLIRALCGHLPNAEHATRDHDAVTCRLCIRDMKASPIPVEALAPEPWVAPPEREVKPGQTELSPVARKAIAESIAGRREQPVFGSMDKALELYAVCCVDGYSGGSASGGHEALAMMGTMIQVSGRGSSATTRQAEDVAQVAMVLEHAFSAWEETHPYAEMGQREALGAYLLMRVGLPVLDKSKRHAGLREYRPKGGLRAWSPLKATALHEMTGVGVKELGGLNKWANRRVDAEMCFRGVIPMPHNPGTEDERRQRIYARRIKAISRRAELGRTG